MFVLKLLLGLIIIVLGAHLFTNGIEWIGKKFSLSQGTVGSVLAAVGTALPESIIPIVAILTSVDNNGAHVGIGAILGAPLMLATLGFLVVGGTAFFYASKREAGRLVNADYSQMRHDLSYFLSLFGLALLASFLPAGWPRFLIVFLLIIGYGRYVYRIVKEGSGGELPEVHPLYFSPSNPNPALIFIFTQVILALGIMVAGAHAFVGGIEVFAQILKMDPLLITMIVAPIATELPEKFNSIIWVRQNKDTMALGNMTGAMVFQSSLLPAVGILATDWVLAGVSLVGSVLTLIAGSYVWALNWFEKGNLNAVHLVVPAIFYVLFIIIVL